MFENIKTLRFGLFGILFVAGFIVLSAGAANAQGPVGQILTRMQAHYDRLNSLQSDIEMKKTDTGLGVTDTSTGNIMYLPKKGKQKMYARLDWSTPVKESMTVIGDEYKIYRPAIDQAIVGKTDSAAKSGKAGGALSFISMSKDELKANYEIVFVNQETIANGPLTAHLQLTPKKPQSYKLADIWVDGDGMLRRFQITEKNNDLSVFLLTNIQKNITLNASVFTLSWPAKTKIIKG